jgi:hypothetical protein
MTTREAKAKLYDQTWLLGGFRRKGAVKELADSADPEAAVLLAEAMLANHPLTQRIRDILVALRPPSDQAKIDQLWRLWGKGRNAELKAFLRARRWSVSNRLLKELAAADGASAGAVALMAGADDDLGADAATVRMALQLASADQDQEVRAAALRWLERLPNEEWLNNELCAHWARSESAELETLLRTQKRIPGNLTLEVLFALVTGQTEAYLGLEDQDGEQFRAAYAMASESQRGRIKELVIGNGDARLVEAYRRATLAVGRHDPQTELDAAVARDDHDALFEAMRHLTLKDALPYVEQWADSGKRPQEPRRRQVVDTAVAAYQSMGKLEIDAAPAPPKGLTDIFAYWQAQGMSEAELRQKLASGTPLERAGALYVGHGKGLISEDALQKATRADDWPVRLVARLLNPVALEQTVADRVAWIGACSGVDAELIQAKLAGTPDEYRARSRQLADARRAKTPPAQRVRALLQLACAFQGAFVESDIVVDDAREATEQGAIEISDAGTDALEDAPTDLF